MFSLPYLLVMVSQSALAYYLLCSTLSEMSIEKESVVMVVSPLLALMQDQVASFEAMGISAISISDKESLDKDIKGKIKNGEFQIIFVSPEALFASLEWRTMISTAQTLSVLLWMKLIV